MLLQGLCQRLTILAMKRGIRGCVCNNNKMVFMYSWHHDIMVARSPFDRKEALSPDKERDKENI